MRLAAAIIASLVGSAVAFAPQPNLARRSPLSALQMSTEAVPITVTGNNIEVTPALQDYVVKKLELVSESVAGLFFGLGLVVGGPRLPRRGEAPRDAPRGRSLVRQGGRPVRLREGSSERSSSLTEGKTRRVDAPPPPNPPSGRGLRHRPGS